MELLPKVWKEFAGGLEPLPRLRYGDRDVASAGPMPDDHLGADWDRDDYGRK